MANESNNSVDEIKERYANKQPLTKDEFLYVICGFNPDYDSPCAMFAYIERYEAYKVEIKSSCMQNNKN